jgi:hypothetical protein
MDFERTKNLEMIIFPILFDSSFFIIFVVLLSKRKIYVFSSVSLMIHKEEITNIKIKINAFCQVIRNVPDMIININNSNPNWTLYNDNQNPNYKNLMSNSGIYACLFMIELGINVDLIKVEEIFEKPNNYSTPIFFNINSQTLSFERKLIAVMIHDANYFLNTIR